MLKPRTARRPSTWIEGLVEPKIVRRGMSTTPVLMSRCGVIIVPSLKASRLNAIEESALLWSNEQILTQTKDTRVTDKEKTVTPRVREEHACEVPTLAWARSDYNDFVKLFPYARLTLQTPLSPEEVEARLTTMLTKPAFSFRVPPEPFRGYMSRRQFKVMRVLGLGRVLRLPHRNSFQPVIIGVIEPAPSGTIIRLRMRLHAFVAAFMTVWFGFPLAFIGSLLWTGLREGFGLRGRSHDRPDVGLAVLGAILLFGLLLVNVCFWTEVKKARSILCERLECRELQPGNPASTLQPY